MPLNQKAQQKASPSVHKTWANPNLESRVNGVNEASVDEAYSGESEEEDEYDNEEKEVSQDPFNHVPRMPPYDFAKRKLSQLIGLDSL